MVYHRGRTGRPERDAIALPVSAAPAGHPLAPDVRRALARLTQALGAAPAARGPLSDERFDAAHEAFERSGGQQEAVFSDLRNLAAGVRAGGRPARVLSVGPGKGMLDLPLIRSLAAAGVAADYTAVDPNPVGCRHFRAGFRGLDPRSVRGVSLDVRQCGVDDLPPGAAFDLIHAVHSLYYVPDPAAPLDGLLGRLAPGGRLVLYLAPRGALNALAEPFWRGDPGRPVWFSDRLAARLAEVPCAFESRRIDARLDVTAALDPADPRGRLVLDFLLHADAAGLSGPVRSAVGACLKAMSSTDGGRLFAPHPVDRFVVSPA